MYFLWFILIIFLLSLIFQFLFRYLPYIILAGLIIWILRRISDWFSERNSRPSNQSSFNDSQRHTTSGSRRPDVIDVDYEEREVDR